MSFLNIGLNNLKQNCWIYFNPILFVFKVALTFSICWVLKNLPQFQTLWFWLTWVIVSSTIDSLLIFKNPSFFANLLLSEEVQRKYELNTEEFKKYLDLSPKIRLNRTLFVTFSAFIFFPISSWQESLPIGLIIGFIVIDTLARKFFNIKAPKIFKASNRTPQSSFDFHRNNAGFPGSAAWNALQSTSHSKRDNKTNL